MHRPSNRPFPAFLSVQRSGVNHVRGVAWPGARLSRAVRLPDLELCPPSAPPAAVGATLPPASTRRSTPGAAEVQPHVCPLGAGRCAQREASRSVWPSCVSLFRGLCSAVRMRHAPVPRVCVCVHVRAMCLCLCNALSVPRVCVHATHSARATCLCPCLCHMSVSMPRVCICVCATCCLCLHPQTPGALLPLGDSEFSA